MRLSSVGILVVFTLAACGGDESTTAAPPAEPPASTAAPAVMTAVVQSEPLTIAPVGSDMQVIGADRTITVEPVVAGNAVDLQPVTR